MPVVPSPSSRGVAWSPRRAAVLLVAAVLCAYANSFSTPFVFDDHLAIVENPTIRRLTWAAFSPPHGQGLTVEGRPLLNFSLALNYAISGADVWSYHATNIAIHLLAALTLFGLVRLTLSGVEGRTPIAPNSQPLTLNSTTGIAFAIALLWAVHPLQTESVTYLVQRTESLMGLFYLLTLYAFARGTTCHLLGDIQKLSPSAQNTIVHPSGDKGLDGGHTGWLLLSIAACALGMTTKEVMVSAPLMVLLYDRTFVAGSFRAAWRQRRSLYLGLAATWVLLGFLLLGAGNRGGTIGASAGVTWWQYAMCQSRAIVHYLQLAVWPAPLIFDYGADFVTFGEIVPYAILDAVLLGLTVFAVWRKPALGFLGAWFFVILAPTSSVVGGTRQMLAEHRMYLSLAAVVVLVVLGLHAWLGRRGWLICAGLGVALTVATARRNLDYQSELSLYADTVAKRPNNVHARYNLGKALAEAGQLDDALVQDTEAVRLKPDLVSARYNLANALSSRGRFAEAIAHYEAAVRLKPDYAKAHFNLGNALLQQNRKAEAAEHYRAAVRAEPAYVEARDNLGSVLLDLGQLPEAEEQFQQVLRLNPNQVETHCNLGAVYFLQGKLAASATEYERALQLNPRFAPAREGLARVRAARP